MAMVVRASRPVRVAPRRAGQTMSRTVGGGASSRTSVRAQAAKKGGGNEMVYFQKYLSTAPVLMLLTVSGLSGLVIEINRYFPDLMTLSSIGN